MPAPRPTSADSASRLQEWRSADLTPSKWIPPKAPNVISVRVCPGRRREREVIIEHDVALDHLASQDGVPRSLAANRGTGTVRLRLLAHDNAEIIFLPRRSRRSATVVEVKRGAIRNLRTVSRVILPLRMGVADVRDSGRSIDPGVIRNRCVVDVPVDRAVLPCVRFRIRGLGRRRTAAVRIRETIRYPLLRSRTILRVIDVDVVEDPAQVVVVFHAIGATPFVGKRTSEERAIASSDGACSRAIEMSHNRFSATRRNHPRWRCSLEVPWAGHIAWS